MSRRVVPGLLLAGIAASAVSCGATRCTVAGCAPGLTVRLATMPTEPFRVEVSSVAQTWPVAYVYDCPDPARCTQEPFFPDFIPEQVSVRVTVGSRTVVRQNIVPVWTAFYPNGPMCGSPCWQATIIAELPQ